MPGDISRTLSPKGKNRNPVPYRLFHRVVIVGYILLFVHLVLKPYVQVAGTWEERMDTKWRKQRYIGTSEAEL